MKLERVKDAWLMIGLTSLTVFMALLLLELSLSLLFRLPHYQPPTDRRIRADTYMDASWTPQYYKEVEEAGRRTAVEWTPYIYWRHLPYRGEYVNVDSKGMRITTAVARQSTSRAPLKIFMFGGSTLWGVGARDVYTVPSILRRELQNGGIDSDILNLAETGYVSTQEVLTLMLTLRKGDVPDLVIFYDGINDTYSAYQQHVAGIPQSEFHRAVEFNLSAPDKLRERWELVVQDVAGQFSTVRFLRMVLDKLGVAKPTQRWVPEATTESLAQAVLATYTSNIELVRMLAEHYGFDYLFYWQPTIYQKAHLTKYESAEREREVRLAEFYHVTYDALRHSRLVEERQYHFRDLSLAFFEVREPLFVEWHHLGESGNEIIAKSMVPDILRVARRRRHID